MTKNSSGNLGDVWPPGFRFHPTDEELVLYYLKRKICRRKLKLDIVGVVDVYKCEPEELPGLSLLKMGDRQWFFFSPRDRKYPNGSRSNRATRHGYWKATGKDRNISCNARTVGIKKTLVFYKGRAPNGERTDWVMHEYTLDEDELRRCQEVQEYYALYKVFKKSGLGPKNGEQYGAPFREADWADDEQPEVSNYSDPDNHVKQSNGIAPADKGSDKLQGKLTWIDIEEFMNKMADVPLSEGTSIDNYAGSLPQVTAAEEDLSSMSDPSFGRAFYVDPRTCSSFSQHNREDSINFTVSATSQLPVHDAPEVSCTTHVANLNHHVAEDDFLEMNDLLGLELVSNVGELHDPQPSSGELIEPQPENLTWGELDEMSELDLYYDAQMFFRELGAIDEAATANYSHVDAQESQLVNPVSFEEVLPSYNLNNYSGTKMVTCDKNGFTPDASQQSLGSASNSGVVCGGIFTPNAMESHENKNRSGKGVEGAENWYTSALWSFVESIPTAPASAADSALVNRAFERMSSFGRLRLINAKSTTTTHAASNAVDSTVTSSSRSGRINSSCGAGEEETGCRMKGGFFLFSFLGVLLAVLFVVIGSLSKVMPAHEYVNS